MKLFFKRCILEKTQVRIAYYTTVLYRILYDKNEIKFQLYWNTKKRIKILNKTEVCVKMSEKKMINLISVMLGLLYPCTAYFIYVELRNF